jgi:hypothetical protein
MGARGQVSMFIIIGIVLVLAVGTVLYLSSAGEKTQRKNLDIVTSPTTFAQQCLDVVATDAVSIVSKQGGFYSPPKASVGYAIYSIPDYYDYGAGPLVPSIETVQDQLSLFVSENLPDCTGDFATYVSKGYNVNVSGINVRSEIAEKSVNFDVEYSVALEKDGTVSNLPPLRKEVGADLLKSYTVASEYVQAQAEQPDYIRLTSLMDLVHANDLTHEVVYQGDHVVYLLFNNETKLNDREYVYAFAVRYNATEAEETGIVSSKRISGLKAYTGYPFKLKLNETGEYATFTDLFNVSPEGQIEFTPSEEDAGMHNVLVVAGTNVSTTLVNIQIEIIPAISGNSKPKFVSIEDHILNASTDPLLDMTLKAVDPDNDTIFYTLDGHEEFTMNPATGQIKADLRKLEQGAYKLTVTAVDVKLARTQESFYVVVLI